MNAQNLQRLPMKQYFQHPGGPTRDLRPGKVSERRVSNLIGNLFRRQFLLRQPHRTDFRKRVDPRRDVFDQMRLAFPEYQMSGREPPLVVCRAGQVGIPHHVAHRVDVALSRLVVFIHDYIAPVVTLDADLLQTHPIRISRSALRPEQAVAEDFLIGFEVQAHAVIVRHNPFVLLVVSDQHPLFTQVIAQRIHDLVVQEGQQTVQAVNQVHLDLQTSENGCILAADHPRSVDCHRPGMFLKRHYRIAVHNARMREIHVRRVVWPCTGGNDESVRAVTPHTPVLQKDLNSMTVLERGAPVDHIHKIPGVESLAQVDLLTNHALRRLQKILKPGVVVPTGIYELLDGVPQRLAGNGGLMGATSAHRGPVIHHGDPLPLLGRLHGRALSTRPAPDYDHVKVIFHITRLCSLRHEKTLSRRLPTGDTDPVLTHPGLPATSRNHR